VQKPATRQSTRVQPATAVDIRRSQFGVEGRQARVWHTVSNGGETSKGRTIGDMLYDIGAWPHRDKEEGGGGFSIHTGSQMHKGSAAAGA
jgi:hypothetical protein